MKQQKTGRLSLRGWFGRMLRQPPRGFYGQPSVYLSGGVMEIEHFRRVRTYEEGRLCLEFAGGLFTVYGDGLRIETLAAHRITLRGAVLTHRFFQQLGGDAASYSFGPGQHFLPGTVIPMACSPKLHGQACISPTSSLLPAALRPGARHGVTSGWQNLPASGGCICASAKRQGCFFLLRPYLRRRGLWAGLLLFVPLLLWSQGLVWAVDASGLTTGQQARAASVLRETVSLMPGSIVTQEKLAAGEYALLQSGEFSWVSLNFLDGRLVLEAAEAKPVPEIAAGTLHGLRAKAAGTVVNTNLVSGTMLVVPGQAVEKGQGLIGTARAERDGTLIFQPAAGSVRAQFEWEFAEELPLMAATYQLTGNTVVQRRLFLAGRVFPLPSLFLPADDSTAVTRHLQPELLGLTLPLSVEETTYYEQAESEVHSSEDEARALARLHGLQALQNDYPDAEFVAQKVDVTTENDMLHYRVVYTIIADICT